MHKGLGDLKLEEIQVSSKGVRHVRFRQTYHGIPIYEAGYQVHIRSDGRIDMANGRYYQNIKASTTAGISVASAKRKALGDFGGQVKLKWKPKSELMIYRNPDDEKFSLAWKVLLPTSEPEAAVWQYFIEAVSGQILHKLNLAPSITGDANIITDNPVTTPTPVQRNLYRLDGSGYLRGTYANVHNDVANRAYSSANNFIYSTSNTHFDEANVYYHIDDYRQNYLDNIGFAGVDIGSDLDLEATVHADDIPTAAVARYIPGSGHEEIRFAQVTAGPRSAKVIYHEMTHAVADMENGHITCDFTEEGSICEGLADYFADSYSDDSKIGIAFSGSPRDAENPIYPDYFNLPRNNENNVSVEPHDGGTFFSAILWDIRNGWLNGIPNSEGNITQQEADEDIFEAIGRVSHNTDFIEFRDAMIAADGSNYGGDNEDFIQNAFAARGVGSPVPPPPPPSPDVFISGPSNLFEGQTGTFSAQISGGQPPYQYLWSSSPATSTSSSSTYQYTPQVQGTKTIHLHVEDSQGGTQDVQTTVTVIGTAGPTAN